MIDSSFSALVGERVTVRRFRQEDIAAFVAYRADPEVARFQGWGDGFTDEQGGEFWAAIAKDHPGSVGEWFQFAVDDGSGLAGDIGVFFERDGAATIGYTLATDKQGRGLATEAVRLVIGYLREVHGVTVVRAGTLPENARSIALLRRLGFELATPVRNDGEIGFELRL